MFHNGKSWCSARIPLSNRQFIAVLLITTSVVLCLVHPFRPVVLSPASSSADYLLHSETHEIATEQPFNAKQQEHQLSIPLDSTTVKLWLADSDAHLEHTTESISRFFDLGWQGFSVTCLDTVPSNIELRDCASRPGHVEITYAICCNVGSTGPPTSCRKALKPLIIPRLNAEAARAAGDRTTTLSTINAEQEFVFVTGASENHYQESLTLVRGIQIRFPTRTIIYWDLGLEADQAAEVNRFCNVIYRQFNFSRYPRHVRNLFTYAFKSLCIMETLAAEYRLLWWVDASIRFTGDDLSNGLAMLPHRHGLVMFREPDHSVWSTTYPQTYEYIATDVAGLQQTVTCAGSSFVVASTPEIFSTFLYWLFACVLDERCIAPVDRPELCNPFGPTEFAGCHRFDQSVMTILAANFWGFGSDNYRFHHDYFHLERWPDYPNDPRRC